MELLEKDMLNLLYPNGEEATKLDPIKAQKTIFELLKECIKDKNYVFNIKSYYFNVTPKNLSVKYKTEFTEIEVSNQDVFFETQRAFPSRYFVLSPEEKKEYPLETKAISVGGYVLNYDGFISEQYIMNLYSKEENEDIKEYLSLPAGGEYLDNNLVLNTYSTTISKDVNLTDSLTDIRNLFKVPVIPVRFDPRNSKYIKEDKYEPEEGTYEKYAPALQEKKDLISLIYSTIIDFYSRYMNSDN